MKTTNQREAIEQDQKYGGEVYVDMDAESNDYGVFGTDSGFCYGLFGSEEDAKTFAAKMNADYFPKPYDCKNEETRCEGHE